MDTSDYRKEYEELISQKALYYYLLVNNEYLTDSDINYIEKRLHYLLSIEIPLILEIHNIERGD